MAVNIAANQDTIQTPRWQQLLESFGGAPFVVQIVERAAEVVMEIYNRPYIHQQQKGDGSPVSEADLAAADLIERELKQTGIPVVCEESITAEHQHLAQELFWLVDPLDGTKEFLAKNGEFTINVALVAKGVAVLGVIGIPVTGEIYLAVKGGGAQRIYQGSSAIISNQRTTGNLIAAVSRSHGSDAGESWLRDYGVSEKIRCGSAIKFCRVAEGSADIYLRFGRTMEWDTAAGQCILEESGCKVLNADNGERLEYGKSGFANPNFIACRADLKIPNVGQNDRVGNL